MKPERQKTMHQQDTKDHQNMSQTSPLCEFVKKFTQIALSFSLFSFIFLHRSWFSHSIHSVISQLSKNPSQLLSVVTDKNYIFLLCNGILVFVARYSNRTDKNQLSTRQDDQMMNNPDYNDELMLSSYPQTPQPSLEKLIMEDKYVIAEEEQEKDMRLEEKEVMAEEEQEEENAQFLNTYGREKEEEDDGISGDAEYEDNKECVQEVSENGSYIEEEGEEKVMEEEVEEEEDQDDDSEEEEEGIAEMSTEELNSKFEEFIRKMKEELRIEAQQQLIMV